MIRDKIYRPWKTIIARYVGAAAIRVSSSGDNVVLERLSALLSQTALSYECGRREEDEFDWKHIAFWTAILYTYLAPNMNYADSEDEEACRWEHDSEWKGSLPVMLESVQPAPIPYKSKCEGRPVSYSDLIVK